MAEKNHSGEDEALKQRLDQLTKALDGKRQETEQTRRTAQKANDGSLGKAMGTGFRVASELAAGILVGAFLGWQLDKWADSSPWGLLGFLILGTIAGFWNVYKLAARPTGDGKPPEA